MLLCTLTLIMAAHRINVYKIRWLLLSPFCQLALQCTQFHVGSKVCEVIVERKTHVGECCAIMVHTLGLEGKLSGSVFAIM